MTKISVIIPVYNEVQTIDKIVSRVQSVDIEKELIIVDDCSIDGTYQKLLEIDKKYKNVKTLRLDCNRGKGAALQEAFHYVKSDFIVIQDADLEYDPREYFNLMEPLFDNRADVVYGSRFLGGPHRVLLFWHYLGNKFLTFLVNLLCNINLSDMETCYKAFKSDILIDIKIKSNRFGFEPEFTVKVAKKKYRIYEVPISYSGRTYSEGKKITWKDGFIAIFTIIWFRIFN